MAGVAGEEGEGEVEELTSHYVQLQDGTYAQMVEGHHIVKPGQQMLVTVLWNRNYFLRFRFWFLLLKSFGSGSGSDF
jgi:hypothetical protein